MQSALKSIAKGSDLVSCWATVQSGCLKDEYKLGEERMEEHSRQRHWRKGIRALLRTECPARGWDCRVALRIWSLSRKLTEALEKFFSKRNGMSFGFLKATVSKVAKMERRKVKEDGGKSECFWSEGVLDSWSRREVDRLEREKRVSFTYFSPLFQST